MRRAAPCWLYVMITLSHVLCLRVSQVLALRANDFDWKKHRVRIKPLKRGAEVYKWILSTSRSMMQGLRKKGIVVWRTRQAGARGEVRVKDAWHWPKPGSGLLFPSTRNKGQPMTKDIVSHAIVRARQTFKAAGVDVTRIRSHSGRHRTLRQPMCHRPLAWFMHGLRPRRCTTCTGNYKSVRQPVPLKPTNISRPLSKSCTDESPESLLQVRGT